MSKTRSRKGKAAGRRCLIVERHAWETGFASEQLQLPLAVANEFFGPGDRKIPITIRLVDAPGIHYPCEISRQYGQSGTRRVNGLPFLGLLGPCFVFFQEADEAGVYDLWAQYDMAVVVGRFPGWRQARSSQYGRGRLAIIVNAPVERPVDRISLK